MRRASSGTVWAALVRQAVMRDLQFRTQTWLNLVAGLAELGVSLVPVLVLDAYASDVAGQPAGLGLLVVALYGISSGVVDCFVAPGLRRFDVTLRRGDLDLALLRPGSTFLAGVLRWVQPAELGKSAAGLVLLAPALARTDAQPTGAGVVAAIVWLACGVIAYGCLWTNLVLLAFWTRSIAPVNDLAAGLRTAGQYPLAYFPGWARGVLVTVVPAGLLAPVPAEQLLVPGWSSLLAVPAVGLAVLLTSWHWRAGLRRYESASS